MSDAIPAVHDRRRHQRRDEHGADAVLRDHLHLDHTGAVAVIDRFPNAGVLVTRTEHEFAHTPDPRARISYVPRRPLS